MSLKQTLEKHGATPGKLALIGVLSLVLVAVVLKQLPGGDKGGSAQRSVRAPQPQGDVAKTANKSNAETKRELPQWPTPNLMATMANNPFVLPSWAKTEAAKIAEDGEGKDGLSEMKEQGASVVVIGTNVKSASIGDKRYYVGDILEGYRVTDITAKGILLNKMKSP